MYRLKGYCKNKNFGAKISNDAVPAKKVIFTSYLNIIKRVNIAIGSFFCE
jgi:hypothetical protein